MCSERTTDCTENVNETGNNYAFDIIIMEVKCSCIWESWKKHSFPLWIFPFRQIFCVTHTSIVFIIKCVITIKTKVYLIDITVDEK